MYGGAWCRLLSMGSQRVGHDWATSVHFPIYLTYISFPHFITIVRNSNKRLKERRHDIFAITSILEINNQIWPIEYSVVLVLIMSVVSNPAIPGAGALQVPLSMGILQARILEWIAMPSARGACQPRNQTRVSYIVGGFFTSWAIREALNMVLVIAFLKAVHQTGEVIFYS